MATERVEIVVSQRGAGQVRRDIDAIGKTSGGAASAVRFLRRALASLGVALGVDQLRRYADGWTAIQNSLRQATGSAEELRAVQERLFAVAQRTQTEFASVTSLYSRLSISGRELGASQEELIRFTEGIGMALAVQGTSAQAASGALLQLSQALGGSVVRAQEFNSILEGAPAILRFAAQGIEGTEGSVAKLRNIMLEGKLSSQELFRAILEQVPNIEEAFGRAVPTIGQSLTVLNNALGRLVGEADQAAGISTFLARGIILLADNMDVAAGAALSLGAGLAVAFSPTLLRMIQAATSAVQAFTVALVRNPIGALAVGIAAAVTALTYFRDEIVIVKEEAITLGDYMRAAFEVASTAVDTARGYLSALSESLSEVAVGFFGAVGGAEDAMAGVLSAVRGGINSVIGLFVGAYAAVKAAWNGLPLALEDIFVRALNAAVTAVEAGVNKVLSALNSLPGIALDPVSLGRLARSGGASIGETVGEAFSSALSYDYVGAAGEVVSRGVESLTERARRFAEERRRAQEELASGGVDLSGGGGGGGGSGSGSADALAAVNRELERQDELLRASKEHRQDLAELYRIEDKLKQDDIVLTAGQREQLLGKIAALRELSEEVERQEELFASIRGPQTEYARNVLSLTRLLEQGKISVEEYTLALRDQRIEFLDGQRDFASGVERGLLRVNREFEDMASLAEDTVISAFKGMEDALVEFVTTGKLEFGDLVDSILADLARMAIRNAITAPLANAIGGLFTNFFHTGGVVGETAATRYVDASAFAFAKRYHRGGIANDEVPAVLKKGEEVLTESDPRHVRNGGGAGVRVNIIDRRGADAPPVEVAESRGPNGERQVDVTILQSLNRSSRNGSLDGVMKTYGARRAGVQRG